MTGRVIQGFFMGGRPAVPGASRASSAPAGAPVQRAARAMPGPPAPAFAGRSVAAQAKPAPGRPLPSFQPAQAVQRRGDGDFAVDPVQLGLARGGGRPLPTPLLAKMEAAFGADFSTVRVHVGPQAARIGALAFTTGNDLYFAPGQYQPDSVRGQQLIGHELAHVIQQRQGRVRAPGSGVSIVQDHALEAEADRLGQRAAMFRPGLRHAGSGRGLSGGPVQRARAIQPMMFETTGDWSGGGGDDRRPPGRWHPDDKVSDVFLVPRTKLKGGKHFIPANWIDRFLTLAVLCAGNVGRIQQIMGDLHDLVGGDAPMELSSKYSTKSGGGIYTSLNKSSEKGMIQVFGNLRELFREWEENIFSNDEDSCGDGGGRRIDMPDAPSTALAMRLTRAATAFIHFFNRWCDNSAVDLPMEGGDQNLTWSEVRAMIMEAMVTITLRANPGPGNYGPNHKFF